MHGKYCMQCFILLLKLQCLSAYLISRREAKKEGAGLDENEKMGEGIVSLVLCLFAGFPLCCFLFEPVAIKEHCVQGRNKRVQIGIHFE